jgi:hypothetical protein
MVAGAQPDPEEDAMYRSLKMLALISTLVVGCTTDVSSPDPDHESKDDDVEGDDEDYEDDEGAGDDEEGEGEGEGEGDLQFCPELETCFEACETSCGEGDEPCYEQCEGACESSIQCETDDDAGN